MFNRGLTDPDQKPISQLGETEKQADQKAALNETGKKLYAAGEYDSAANMFERAAKMGSASGLYNLSYVNMQRGNLDEGAERYRRAHTIDPDYKRLLDIQLVPPYIQIESVRTMQCSVHYVPA